MSLPPKKARFSVLRTRFSCPAVRAEQPSLSICADALPTACLNHITSCVFSQPRRHCHRLCHRRLRHRAQGRVTVSTARFLATGHPIPGRICLIPSTHPTEACPTEGDRRRQDQISMYECTYSMKCRGNDAYTSTLTCQKNKGAETRVKPLAGP